MHFYCNSRKRRLATRHRLARRSAFEQAGDFPRVPRLKEWCTLSIVQWLKGLADNGYDASLAHVSPRVADALLEQADQEQLRLGGEMWEISALSVDVRKFIPFSQRLAPNEVVGLLNRHVEVIVGRVMDNAGVISDWPVMPSW